MRRAGPVATCIVVAAALGLGVAPGSATTTRASKPPNPCKVLLPDDLKTVFNQPWRKGVEQVGGACEWSRPPELKIPNIVVALIVEQKASTKQAKRAFARGRIAAEDIAQLVEPIRGLGNEAYLTTILGADVLSFRVGRDLAEIRVHRIDKLGETYRDQVLAIGDVVEARLLPPSPTSRQPGG
jgi:hypothetical protein